MPSKIEWTEETWNPLVGCSRVSPGCDHCYAVSFVHRELAPQHRGLTVVSDDGVDWNGDIRQVRSMLDRPLRWTRPRKVFVNSLSDLFHPSVPDSFICEVFAVMGLAAHHTFQVLTKRPQRARELLSRDTFASDVLYAAGRLGQPAELGGLGQPTSKMVVEHFDRLAEDRFPLSNVWLGTSVESDRYSFRVSHLAATPAAVRWVSAEPLLGPLEHLDVSALDWVVAGGESGPAARPMHPDWVRDLRDRCAAADVPFLMKQWGEWAPAAGDTARTHIDATGAPCDPASPTAAAMDRPGKRHTGRLLDGELYDAYPTVGDQVDATATSGD